MEIGDFVIIIMLTSLILYKYVQPAIYLIIAMILFDYCNNKDIVLKKIENFAFFSSIPVFLTLILFIFSGGDYLLQKMVSAIPQAIEQEDGIREFFLEASPWISWLLCGSVVPLRFLFNKFKISIKIGLILYAINFIFYFPFLIMMVFGNVTFP